MAGVGVIVVVWVAAGADVSVACGVGTVACSPAQAVSIHSSSNPIHHPIHHLRLRREGISFPVCFMIDAFGSMSNGVSRLRHPSSQVFDGKLASLTS